MPYRSRVREKDYPNHVRVSNVARNLLDVMNIATNVPIEVITSKAIEMYAAVDWGHVTLDTLLLTTQASLKAAIDRINADKVGK